MTQRKKRSKPKRIIRKIVLWLLFLALLAGAGVFGWSALRQQYTVTYDAYAATIGSISNALSFSGNLNLIDSAVYTAPSASKVRAVSVSPGDSVKKGDKLVRLANGSTVEADFDGRVNTVSVKAGDEVKSGDTLLQVADFTHMKVSMRVDEYDIGDIDVGQKCVVTVTSNERRYESEIGSIDRISASGGSVAYYTAVAYVDVTDDETLPGMQVTVSVPQEEATDAVILKLDALSFDETNAAYVWMKDETGALSKTYVKTGVSNGNYVEITDGLSDGDEVFVEAKAETTSTVSGLLSGLFGSQRFSGGTGARGSFGGNMPGGITMPESFGGNMPGAGTTRGNLGGNSAKTGTNGGGR